MSFNINKVILNRNRSTIRLHKFIIIICFIVLAVPEAIPQGCSDAGFCTMGAMKPDQDFNKKVPIRLRALELNFYRGTSTLSPVIYVGTVDFTFAFKEKTSFQIKVPYQYVNGNFGSTSGPGDISISTTRRFYDSENFEINGTLGTKIPTNQSDLQNFDTGSGRDYPMYYQVSLGSFDFIAGASMITRDWLVATGIQIALTKNDNLFRWSEWPEYPDQNYLRDNDIAKELKRGTDIMFRVERNFRYGRWNFNLGLLPIFRITKDEILDESSGERIKLDGTAGLALSALAGAGYQFNVNSGIKLILGRKITQREVNPDGLTRDAVNSISYVYKF